MSVGAWQGPGVQPDGGLVGPTEVVVSTTFAALKEGDAPAKLFQSLFVDIGKDLETRQGLVAWQAVTSTRCNTGRTLSVWKDEASMFTFAAGRAHARAIAESRNLSRGGSAVTHWRAPLSDVNFDRAIEKLRDSDASPF